MGTSEVELDDDAVKRAQVSKLTMEALVSAVMVLVYAKLLLSDDVKYLIKQRLARLRFLLFGPPPLTEEQVQAAERQTVVEAMRIVRYGNDA